MVREKTSIFFASLVELQPPGIISVNSFILQLNIGRYLSGSQITVIMYWCLVFIMCSRLWNGNRIKRPLSTPSNQNRSWYCFSKDTFPCAFKNSFSSTSLYRTKKELSMKWKVRIVLKYLLNNAFSFQKPKANNRAAGSPPLVPYSIDQTVK